MDSKWRSNTPFSGARSQQRKDVAVIKVEPAGTEASLVCSCMQTRLVGQYNGKQPVGLVYVSKPLITVVAAIVCNNDFHMKKKSTTTLYLSDCLAVQWFCKFVQFRSVVLVSESKCHKMNSDKCDFRLQLHTLRMRWLQRLFRLSSDSCSHSFK